jgi:hypothetical protein
MSGHPLLLGEPACVRGRLAGARIFLCFQNDSRRALLAGMTAETR